MNTEPVRADDVRHVLVLEDEPQMRSMLTDNLEFEGYRVTAVATGEEALQAVTARHFALLLVDVMLPGMSGFDVCQQLRARGMHVPIVVLTARSGEQDRVRGLDLGADDYVSKPLHELLACGHRAPRRPAHAGQRRIPPSAPSSSGCASAGSRRPPRALGPSSSCCSTCWRTGARWSAAISCCATSGVTARWW
jgi:DNA-binding response OmpR family regulator